MPNFHWMRRSRLLNPSKLVGLVPLKYALFVVTAYVFVVLIHAQLSLYPSHQTSVEAPARTRSIRYSSYWNQNDTQCQQVHVATYCSDVDRTRNVVSMLHTILFYRTCPLQFHLVVSNNSERTLRMLFDTWQLPNVTIHFYSETQIVSTPKTAKPDDDSIILYKLPSLLPGSVTKVIYASPRMRFLDDVTKLWSVFNASEPWGVSLAVSNDFAPVPGPLMGSLQPHLYDLAVLNLRHLRSNTPGDFWRRATSNYVTPLPCSWSVQMHPSVARQPQQYQEYIKECIHHPQGVIWTAGLNYFAGNVLLENIRQRILDVVNSNGDLFRTAYLCGGKPVEANHTEQLSRSCAEYSYAVQMKRRIHLNFLGAPHYGVPGTDPHDISLTTQFTVDRLYMFEKTARNWDGPMVAIVHASDAEARQLVQGVQQSRFLNSRKNIAYHVVFKRQYYPINILRNLGLNQTQTPYVIFVDVDLVPMPSLYYVLKTRLRELDNGQKKNLIPVVPAFEAFSDLEQFPRDKAELLKLEKEGELSGYRMLKGWKLGHKATNYPKWKTTNESYIVKWEDAFEPYVVLPTKNVPLYHEVLLERMGDKIAYGLQLYAMGYDFLILSDVFVIHLPHPASDGTKVWGTHPTYSRCGVRLIKEYKEDLKTRYPGKKIQ